MESTQQLRHAFPGPVEYAHPVSVFADLSAPADAMVAWYLLSGSPFSGRHRHVLPRVPLDRPSACRGRGRYALCLQWPHLVRFDVAQQHRGAGVDALDLSLIHISEPTRLLSISYAVFC